ncbi:hypothetical protein ACSSWA_00275 [Melioribacter sp. Ez-97]|uniref:hypothetical protein n=1 Tax=Melioribacter sp. Ez-97 TaxID=3423434 RepID=UPI003ED9ACD0
MPDRRIIKITSLLSLAIYISLLGTLFFHWHFKDIRTKESVIRHYDNFEDPYADVNGNCSVEVFLSYNFNSESIESFGLPGSEILLETDLSKVFESPLVLSITTSESRAPPFKA